MFTAQKTSQQSFSFPLTEIVLKSSKTDKQSAF